MPYKRLLYSALLVSNLAVAHIKLDLDLTINKQDYNRHITKELTLENNEKVVLDCDDLIVSVHVKESESGCGVCIQTDIAKKGELNNDTYISRPVLLAEWDKPATIKVGAKVKGEETEMLKLVVKASQVS
jgi:hypothetical protein